MVEITQNQNSNQKPIIVARAVSEFDMLNNINDKLDYILDYLITKLEVKK